MNNTRKLASKFNVYATIKPSKEEKQLAEEKVVINKQRIMAKELDKAIKENYINRNIAIKKKILGDILINKDKEIKGILDLYK
jgi:hypothetical protein